MKNLGKHQTGREPINAAGLPSNSNALLSIFLLLDCTDYEGCSPLRAFKYRDAAECLKSMAEAHDKKMPEIPPVEEDWTEYYKLDAEWKKNHPIADGFEGANFYSIMEVPFSS